MAIAVASGSIPDPDPPPVIQRPDVKASQRELTYLGDQLAASRGFVIVTPTDALDARSGFPQKLYFRSGLLVVVEYLGPGKKLKPAQEQWADQFDSIAARSNGTVRRLAVTPADWDALVRALS